MKRVGVFFAALLALAATPAAAQHDGLRGVWQGTVGDLPIHACFEGDDGHGVYYYDRYMTLIRLITEEGVLAERVRYGEPGTATWQFSAVDAGRASGSWSDGERELPVTLRRLEWTAADEYTSPCESAEFIQPRLEGGSIERLPAMHGDHSYTVLRYVPPPHWRGENDTDFQPVSISTFALPEEQRGDALINFALAQQLPSGRTDDEFAFCFSSNIRAHGSDGDFQKGVMPEVITRRWLGLRETSGVYCGGAHPNYWEERRVFDRATGQEVDPDSWLNDAAAEREILASGMDSFVYTRLTDRFLGAIHPFWEEANDDIDCNSIVMDTPDWDVGLSERGLALIPRVPHVATPCAITVVMPWDAVAPFLSLEGQAVAAGFTEE